MIPELPLFDSSARDELRRAVAGLDDAETRAQPVEMSQALAAVARCYRQLQAMASAEATFAAALRWACHAGSRDLVVDLLCELAETAALQLGPSTSPADPRARHSARERARDHAYDAVRLASEVSDPAWEWRVLLRASCVLEACGDLGDALQLRERAERRGGGRAGPSAGPAAR
jgi:hypothetical protein